ncbi:hypothetical protein OPQ81_000008 [Rhizoctonia solani]|nr:hypothetical protein OPQ81_000008 [Rhizoctonia solani]
MRPRPPAWCTSLDSSISPGPQQEHRLHAHLPGHAPHAVLNLILHARAQAQPLAEAEEVEGDVGAPQHGPEDEVAPARGEHVPPGHDTTTDTTTTSTTGSGGARGGVGGQAGAGPVAHHLDAVDGAAHVLVVALDDAHVAADEEQLLGPPVLVGEDLADPLLHAPLHLVDPPPGLLRAALVRPHQGGAGKQVRRADAPLGRDAGDGGIVRGEEPRPEVGVLAAELRAEADVQAVVDENELGPPGRQPAHKEVPRVRVAVHHPPAGRSAPQTGPPWSP